jgi:hypothetical protein
MNDGPLRVNESDDSHIVEGNQRADGRRDPVEDFLEFESLRGDLGDFGKNTCDNSGIHVTSNLIKN